MNSDSEGMSRIVVLPYCLIKVIEVLLMNIVFLPLSLLVHLLTFKIFVQFQKSLVLC